MKRMLSFFICITMILLAIIPANALEAGSTLEMKCYANENVKLIDLDNWKGSKNYNKVEIADEINTNKFGTSNMVDVINISSDNIKTDDLEYVLQLVDNGATLVVQNKSNISSCEEMGMLLGITESKIAVDFSANDSVFVMGYSVRKSVRKYLIEPVFASVMLPKDENKEYDFAKELCDLKESNCAYVDPIDLYCEIEESKSGIASEIAFNDSTVGKLQLRIRQATESAHGYGYLYGKNGKAVWGPKDGYTEFAYIEISAYVVPEFTKNGHKYDALECLFVATGRGDKYVDSYTVFNEVVSNTFMEGYTKISQFNQNTYETKYSVKSDGTIETSYSVSTVVNPGSQVVQDTKTYNRAEWECTPNSHLKNKSWTLEAGCLTNTSSGKKASMMLGFHEITVDNWLLKYVSPCAITLFINYNR